MEDAGEGRVRRSRERGAGAGAGAFGPGFDCRWRRGERLWREVTRRGAWKTVEGIVGEWANLGDAHVPLMGREVGGVGGGVLHLLPFHVELIFGGNL